MKFKFDTLVERFMKGQNGMYNAGDDRNRFTGKNKKINNNFNNFNVKDFMVNEFGMEKAKEILNDYEESFGVNGLDYLLSLTNEDEVLEAINDFI